MFTLIDKSPKPVESAKQCCATAMKHYGLLSIGWLAVAVILFCFTCGAGCKNETKPSSVSHDVEALKRLCHLPDYVQSAEWQTYQLGGSKSNQLVSARSDWGLIARLTVDEDGVSELEEILTKKTDQQVSMRPDNVPDWLGKDRNSLIHSAQNEGSESRLLYDVAPFKSSPLLHGFVIRPEPRVIIVNLYTR